MSHKFIPIKGTSWKNIAALKVIDKDLIILKDDYEYKLKDKNKFVGHRGDANKPSAIIIKNNQLHFEIIINPKAFSAAHDIAGISDVISTKLNFIFFWYFKFSYDVFIFPSPIKYFFSNDNTSTILNTSIVTQYEHWNRETEVKLLNILKRFKKENNVGSK